MTDGNERPCILIVDDEPININILTELLKSNYKIIAAKNGASALKRLSDGLRPDLILLDVIMPEISGYDVCQQLKSNPETHEIPIIFITSAIKPEEETKGLELGAIDYISKPISPAVVIARVKSHLALQFAQRDMQRQRDFIRQVFGRYMGENRVDLVLASPEYLKLGGEKRRVTLLMCDLRNFTKTSELADPADIVLMLNSFFTEMVTVIEHHNGTIDNFMGDSMLVIFGSPIIQTDHAQRAVNCAIAMQKSMPAINVRHQQEGLPLLQMGIGVNTGEAIIGNIGSHLHMKFSAIGATVNLTARLQAMAIGGQTLISKATYEELNNEIIVNGRLLVQLKGFGLAFEVFDVTSDR